MNSCKNQCQNMASTPRQTIHQTMPECSYCTPMTTEKEKWPIGMTYVPVQNWKDIYPLEEGFCSGTIFKELDLPFTGRRVC